MLTPQDIQTKEFPKAVFGGYDMSAIDDFLEEIETDYSALYKDNAVLKGKMKVLVDKVEEYRSTEDAMRMALMTAQKMSDDMMAETKAKCDEIIKAAEKEAAERRGRIDQDLADEKRRLEIAKAETAKFISASKKLVEDQARFILKIDQMTSDLLASSAPEEPEQRDEPARSPEPEPAARYSGDVTEAEPRNETEPESPTEPEPGPVHEENTGSENGSPSPYDYARENSGIFDNDPDMEEDSETISEIDAIVSDVMSDLGNYPDVEEYTSVNGYDPVLDETKPVPDLSELKVRPNRAPAEWTEEDEEVTPRPKFKFDDLKFGTNYKNGDSGK